MEEYEPFRLKSLDEVVVFNQRLIAYMNKTCPMDLEYIDIVAAYKKCQRIGNIGGNLFTAIVDLKINFISLFVESIEQGKILINYNEILSKNPVQSCLDNDDVFYCKFKLNNSYTNFIIRYRAFFDKFMGILIMIFEPQSYDIYRRANSRKKKFKKILAQKNKISPVFLENLFKVLEDFDRKFRTPEVHGTGVVRKWSFTLYNLPDTPLIELIGYWNYLLPLLTELDRIFKEEWD